MENVSLTAKRKLLKLNYLYFYIKKACINKISFNISYVTDIIQYSEAQFCNFRFMN